MTNFNPKESRCKRKYIRYKPDLNTFAVVNSKKHVSVRALVTEESNKGVRIVSTAEVSWEPNEVLEVTVGELHPVQAIVRWKRKIDINTIVYGLEYEFNLEEI